MEGPFKDPDIPDRERTAYRALVGGHEAGSGEIVVRRVKDGRRDLYRQALQASVGGQAEWRAETTFRRRSGTIHAETHRLQAFNSEPAPIAEEQSRFRGVKALQFGGDVEPYPRDLSPLPGCALALRGLEFEARAQRAFTIWLGNSLCWTVETKVEKRETLKLPVGRLAAWRVRLRPSLEQVDGALDHLVEMLIPPLVMHFQAEGPHRMLRFEFPTGPFRWNPTGLIEATELGDDDQSAH
jgi:hypothetical protein